MSPPRVSVVMTTYNSERFLNAAIESILNQTFSSLELIVVDDGSTDSSARIIRSFSEFDLRVRGIYLARNVGIPKAANFGLRATRGEYVARMDSDDLCHRDRLLKQVSYLDKHKRIHVIGCDYRAIDEEDFFCTDAYAKKFMDPIPIIFGRHCVAENVLYFRYPVLHATIVCRRSTLVSVGGYRDFLPMSEDDDLYSRIVSLHGRVLDSLPQKFYYYRHYNSSTTQRFNYTFRMFMIYLLSLSQEIRRRGFWDPLDARPLSNYKSLRFRGISAFLYLQDSLVFLPVCPRARLHHLLGVVVILRRFNLKDFHKISLLNDLGMTMNKQIYFLISFCNLCFGAKKFRLAFLYLRCIFNLSYRSLFFEIFNALNLFSDNNLRSFRSMIFTKRFHYGLKHLILAFLLSPLRTIRFLVVRSFVHLKCFYFSFFVN